MKKCLLAILMSLVVGIEAHAAVVCNTTKEVPATYNFLLSDNKDCTILLECEEPLDCSIDASMFGSTVPTLDVAMTDWVLTNDGTYTLPMIVKGITGPAIASGASLTVSTSAITKVRCAIEQHATRDSGYSSTTMFVTTGALAVEEEKEVPQLAPPEVYNCHIDNKGNICATHIDGVDGYEIEYRVTNSYTKKIVAQGKGVVSDGALTTAKVDPYGTYNVQIRIVDTRTQTKSTWTTTMVSREGTVKQIFETTYGGDAIKLLWRGIEDAEGYVVLRAHEDDTSNKEVVATTKDTKYTLKPQDGYKYYVKPVGSDELINPTIQVIKAKKINLYIGRNNKLFMKKPFKKSQAFKLKSLLTEQVVSKGKVKANGYLCKVTKDGPYRLKVGTSTKDFYVEHDDVTGQPHIHNL